MGDQEISPMLIEEQNGSAKKSMGKKITLVSLGVVVLVGISVGVSGCAKKCPAPGPAPAPAPEPTPSPPKKPTKVDGHFYSNTKYLADFGADSGVDVDSCESMCADWDNGVCDKKCKAKKECHLDDEVDAKFYTRDVSCKKKCAG